MASAFDSLHIGSMTAKNRFIRAATAESLATPQGKPSMALVNLYEALARGGVGTIITGYMFTRADGKPSEGACGLYDSTFADSFRMLTEAAHVHDARIIAQLVYGGSKSKLSSSDPRHLKPAAASKGNAANVDILGPSSVENPKTHLIPRSASAKELADVALSFAQAALRAKEYGFDGVEIHAAHGYLLSQFLCPNFNKRTDDYGKTLANRARLSLQCIGAVRNAVGNDWPVLVKVNSCDDYNDPEGTRGGLSEDESALVATWLAQAGANCIEVSGAWHTASSCAENGKPYFARFGKRLARKLDIPVVVTGGWRHLGDINRHIAEDGIAAVALSRPLICEPDLIARWQAGKVAPSSCVNCGYCQKHAGIPCSKHAHKRA